MIPLLSRFYEESFLHVIDSNPRLASAALPHGLHGVELPSLLLRLLLSALCISVLHVMKREDSTVQKKTLSIEDEAELPRGEVDAEDMVAFSIMSSIKRRCWFPRGESTCRHLFSWMVTSKQKIT